MGQEVSEILGDGATTQGASVKIYRALRPLLCERCGEEIAQGELFTRWPIAQQLLRIMPRCRRCVPFEFVEQEEGPTAAPAAPQSSLLRELLSANEQSGEVAANHSQDRASRKEQAGDIEKRLGPALRWAKRPKK